MGKFRRGERKPRRNLGDRIGMDAAGWRREARQRQQRLRREAEMESAESVGR